ncbi:hypothetical protein PBCVNEJV1_454L [Paramecium bursaria Chlorella virus NE-JV-1]|nr:hypothetical protein PBCVNEJV1_454L [Paramecium bursaria Chlorella virus NE-JV-1]
MIPYTKSTMDLLVRRAVIIDGAIVEKKLHIGSVEVPAVSQILELERERNGKRNIPRSTITLLESCIRTNDPALWEAAADDVDTNDFDPHAAIVILEQQDILPVLFIGCITSAKSVKHLTDMLRVFFAIHKEVTENISAEFSKAITLNWKALVDVLITLDTKVKRHEKDGMYIAFARFIDAASIQKDALILAVRELLKHNKYEHLAMFSKMDAAMYSEVLPDLIASLKKSAATNRYAIVGLIAKIANDVDILDVDVLPAVSNVMAASIRDKYVDVRTIKACAFLLQKFSDDPVIKNFATLVGWNANQL